MEREEGEEKQAVSPAVSFEEKGAPSLCSRRECQFKVAHTHTDTHTHLVDKMVAFLLPSSTHPKLSSVSMKEGIERSLSISASLS
jgi:hypothetical protein